MKQQILNLLKIEIGFEVNLFSMLWIHQLENGDWRVGIENDNPPPDHFDEYIFEKLEVAVDFFLEKRDEMNLGYDYESLQPLKPKPPMIIKFREDGGPFLFERIFCLFGMHSFQENTRYWKMDSVGNVNEKDIYEKQCVCCGFKP